MYRTKTLTRSVLALGLAAPALGFAASDETIIEQIIVTAQKRASALQDVPFSVGAATEQQIRDSGSTNIVDLARNFAGLTITDLGPGQSQVAIRGISAGQVVRDLVGGVKESVGVYLDESAISQALFTPDLDLFDLERFEVLRGPQGTLFGAGSSAGTVRYITRQPQLGQFEGAAEAGAYTGTDTDFGCNLRGVVNLPMADTAALRIVGYYNELAGFIDSVYPGRARQRRREQRREDRRARRAADSSRTRICRSRRASSTRSWRPTATRASMHYNILGNPFTTTQPAVNPGERGQVTQIPRRHRGRVDAGRPGRQLGSRRCDADFGHFVHGPRRGRGARRLAADRQRVDRFSGAFPASRDVGGSAAELAADRHHAAEDLQPGSAPGLRRRRCVRVAGRRVLPGHRSRVRAEPADAGLRRSS